RCPRTAAVIDSLDRGFGEALFSELKPGANIGRHCGPSNVWFTVHLPIIVPAGDCQFRVGGEARTWEDGKCLVFDDSFWHSAWNRTAHARYVLIVDCWHPELTAAERQMLGFLYARLAPLLQAVTLPVAAPP